MAMVWISCLLMLEESTLNTYIYVYLISLRLKKKKSLRLKKEDLCYQKVW